MTYTPNAGFSGADSFKFRVNDGTSDGNEATVSLTLAPINNAPVSSDGAETMDENGSPLTIDFGALEAARIGG